MASNNRKTKKKLNPYEKRDANIKNNKKGYDNHRRQIEGEMNKALKKIFKD